MKVETLVEELVFSTIRVQASGSNENSVGTGFVFAYESEAISEGSRLPRMGSESYAVPLTVLRRLRAVPPACITLSPGL